MCIILSLKYRSPSRRSSTSSTSSSGGYSGGLNLATAKRANHRYSRSPSPRPVSSANKLSVASNTGRRSRSRSPTPRVDRLTVDNGPGSRSRSTTPSRTRKQRAASPLPSVCGNEGGDRLLVLPNQPNGNRSRSPSATRQRSGVDDTPTQKISMNFTSELAVQINERLSRESSVDKNWEPRKISVDSDNGGAAVDTSSTCRVSDNFHGTEQYHVLNQTPVTVFDRRHSTVQEEESSAVDTTPFCRVSDSLRVTHDGPSAAVGRKKSHSTQMDDKKSEPVGTDSGSEVSDEGYKSLPPAISNANPGKNGKRIR